MFLSKKKHCPCFCAGFKFQIETSLSNGTKCDAVSLQEFAPTALSNNATFITAPNYTQQCTYTFRIRAVNGTVFGDLG
jgi:hypothetical protein